MDISELKKISDKSYEVATEKKNALEKARSRMLLAHDGHIFSADAQTIGLVKALAEDHDRLYILDVNDNPALIDDPEKFLKNLKQKNQEALNTYHNAYEMLKKLG